MKKIVVTVITLMILLVSISSVSAGMLDGLFGDDSSSGSSSLLDSKSEFKLIGSYYQSTQSFADRGDIDLNFNEETLDWLNGLDNYVVFSADGDQSIIMHRNEADLIPHIDAMSDGNINYAVIKADVKETHSMGSGLIDCVLVENVEYIGNETKEI